MKIPVKYEIVDGWFDIVDSEGKTIVGSEGIAEVEEAAHIVHCVNLHDELVAMLAQHYSHHKPCGHDFDCVCLQDEARALLSRAARAALTEAITTEEE